MIKLKDLLKENSPGFENRQFGDPLPTLKSVMKKHQATDKVVKESDLGLTYKKGKTVKVKHKTSGKRLVIVDKPAVRKEYEKIGFYAESVDEMKKLFQITAVKKAIAIAKKMGGNMTGAVKKIEKMNRGLSDEPDVAAALKKANESVNEASVKTGWKLYHVYDINSKLWRQMKYDLRDQFDELVKIGEDYGVFMNAKGTFSILKQIKRLMDKI
jgi:hypothetical protein